MSALLPVLGAFQVTYGWVTEVLFLALVYATLAVSLNLVTGFAGMFSLGHHGMFAVGAYAAAWTATAFAAPPPGSVEGWLLFGASGVVAALASTAAGVAIGLPCLRLRGDYLAIATLGFGEIVRVAIENTPRLGGSLGIVVPRLVMDPTGRLAAFRTTFVAIGVLLVAVAALVVRNLIRSAHGRAIVSVREDEVATEILGVRTTVAKLRAFLLGSAFAGLAGWLYAHYAAHIGPREFDLMTGIRILLIVVLGGLGSITGSILAAVVLVGAERLLLAGVIEGPVGETLKEWVQVEFALLLILLMLLRPSGLLGDRELPALLRGRARERARLDA